MTVTVIASSPGVVVVEQTDPAVVGVIGQPQPAQVGVMAGVWIGNGGGSGASYTDNNDGTFTLI